MQGYKIYLLYFTLLLASTTLRTYWLIDTVSKAGRSTLNSEIRPPDPLSDPVVSQKK